MRPATRPGRTPSMPAATMMTSHPHSSVDASGPTKRCRPATPRSASSLTSRPHASTTICASSAGGGRQLVKRGLVLGGHPADQTLALAICHRNDEAGGVGWMLAGSEDDLGYAATQKAAEIQVCPSAELLELKLAELGDRLVLRELALQQPPQNVLHRPASTSRILCPGGPAP